MFSAACKNNVGVHLGIVVGLCVGDVQKGSVFQTLTWSQQKSKGPVKSIGLAETLRTGSAVDEKKVLVKTYEVFPGIQTNFTIAVDSKHLCYSLSTCRNVTEKSIKVEARLVRNKF